MPLRRVKVLAFISKVMEVIVECLAGNQQSEKPFLNTFKPVLILYINTY